jgi:hypothetical protein
MKMYEDYRSGADALYNSNVDESAKLQSAKKSEPTLQSKGSNANLKNLSPGRLARPLKKK